METLPFHDTEPASPKADIEVHNIREELSVGIQIEEELQRLHVDFLDELTVDIDVEGAPNSYHRHIAHQQPRALSLLIGEEAKRLMVYFEDAATPLWSDNQGIRIAINRNDNAQVLSAFVHRPKS